MAEAIIIVPSALHSTQSLLTPHLPVAAQARWSSKASGREVEDALPLTMLTINTSHTGHLQLALITISSA